MLNLNYKDQDPKITRAATIITATGRERVERLQRSQNLMCSALTPRLHAASKQDQTAIAFVVLD